MSLVAFILIMCPSAPSRFWCGCGLINAWFSWWVIQAGEPFWPVVLSLICGLPVAPFYTLLWIVFWGMRTAEHFLG